jgi:hypothetical protein
VPLLIGGEHRGDTAVGVADEVGAALSGKHGGDVSGVCRVTAAARLTAPAGDAGAVSEERFGVALSGLEARSRAA